MSYKYDYGEEDDEGPAKPHPSWWTWDPEKNRFVHNLKFDENGGLIDRPPSAVQVRGEGPYVKVAGIAARFGALSANLHTPQYEKAVMQPGCFDESLQDGDRVDLTIGHGGPIIATTKIVTLGLACTESALLFNADLGGDDGGAGQDSSP